MIIWSVLKLPKIAWPSPFKYSLNYNCSAVRHLVAFFQFTFQGGLPGRRETVPPQLTTGAVFWRSKPLGVNPPSRSPMPLNVGVIQTWTINYPLRRLCQHWNGAARAARKHDEYSFNRGKTNLPSIHHFVCLRTSSPRDDEAGCM